MPLELDVKSDEIHASTARETAVPSMTAPGAR